MKVYYAVVVRTRTGQVLMTEVQTTEGSYDLTEEQVREGVVEQLMASWRLGALFRMGQIQALDGQPTVASDTLVSSEQVETITVVWYTPDTGTPPAQAGGVSNPDAEG